jgi:hypothetical protein
MSFEKRKADAFLTIKRKKEFECNTACGHYECNDHQGECKRLNKLPEYELNKSTGAVQRVDNDRRS